MDQSVWGRDTGNTRLPRELRGFSVENGGSTGKVSHVQRLDLCSRNRSVFGFRRKRGDGRAMLK
jgi:hypothetical protein